MIEDVLVVEARLRLVELRFDFRQSHFGHIRMLVQDGNEIPILEHQHVLHLLRLGKVNIDQLGAVCRGPQDFCTEHSGKRKISSIPGFPVTFSRASLRKTAVLMILNSDGFLTATLPAACRSIFLP